MYETKRAERFRIILACFHCFIKNVLLNSIVGIYVPYNKIFQYKKSFKMFYRRQWIILKDNGLY